MKDYQTIYSKFEVWKGCFAPALLSFFDLLKNNPHSIYERSEHISTGRGAVFSAFFLFYLLFQPVYGDWFGHFYFVYGYFAATLVLILTNYFVTRRISGEFAAKFAAMILLIAGLFPVGSYFYNGRGGIIYNAAEYDYPNVLNLVLNPADQVELEIALVCAEDGDNPVLVEELKRKGAKKKLARAAFESKRPGRFLKSVVRPGR